jgi:hypothetical protein
MKNGSAHPRNFVSYQLAWFSVHFPYMVGARGTSLHHNRGEHSLSKEDLAQIATTMGFNIHRL